MNILLSKASYACLLMRWNNKIDLVDFYLTVVWRLNFELILIKTELISFFCQDSFLICSFVYIATANVWYDMRHNEY